MPTEMDKVLTKAQGFFTSPDGLRWAGLYARGLGQSGRSCRALHK